MVGDPAADFSGILAAAVVEPAVLIAGRWARRSRSWRDGAASNGAWCDLDSFKVVRINVQTEVQGKVTSA